MPLEDKNEAGKEESEEDEKADACDDNHESCNHTPENSTEVVHSREMLLDLLYLAARNILQREVDASSERMNVEEGEVSSRSVNFSCFLDSARDDGDDVCSTCDDDNEEEEDDSNVDMILEEIRRIVETLLESTESELVDAERRISLKSFDELASRRENLSSIMDEWDYDESEGLENDDYQGVVELFARHSQGDITSRSPTSQQEETHHPTLPSREVPSNPSHDHNTFVFFIDPKKLGVFHKFVPEEEVKSPKVKRTVPMKKVPQKARIDKDQVKRWSAHAEKQEIARMLRNGILGREGGLRSQVQRGWQTISSAPRKSSFAVCLAVGLATPAGVHIAVYSNRVLEAEVVRCLAGGEQSDDILLRHWAVPEDVDVDNLRGFLGDGLLLVTVVPLPDGFAWPFVTPPALLGRPVFIPCPCEISL